MFNIKPEALEISVFTFFLDLMEHDVYLLLELWCYWLMDVSNTDRYNRSERAGILDQELYGFLELTGSKGKHVQLQSESGRGSLIKGASCFFALLDNNKWKKQS